MPTEAQNTIDIIAPIIRETYGSSAMSEALIHHLTGRIEHDWYGYEDQERQIMLTCWDWMTGGTTAKSVAHKITEAINAN